MKTISIVFLFAATASAQRWVNPHFDTHRMDIRDLGYPDAEPDPRRQQPHLRPAGPLQRLHLRRHQRPHAVLPLLLQPVHQQSPPARHDRRRPRRLPRPDRRQGRRNLHRHGPEHVRRGRADEEVPGRDRGHREAALERHRRAVQVVCRRAPLSLQSGQGRRPALHQRLTGAIGGPGHPGRQQHHLRHDAEP